MAMLTPEQAVLVAKEGVRRDRLETLARLRELESLPDSALRDGIAAWKNVLEGQVAEMLTDEPW